MNSLKKKCISNKRIEIKAIDNVTKQIGEVLYGLWLNILNLKKRTCDKSINNPFISQNRLL
ncbi:MAG: hypothetical protein ACTSRP_28265 [Candidatus Helarchaeota archaeon]